VSPVHLLFALAINFIWGFNFIAVAAAVDSLPPVLSNAMRFAIVLIALAPFLRRVRGQMGALLAIAFIMGVMHFAMMFTAMAVAIDIAPLAIAAQTNIPFATLLAVLILGERIGLWRTAGIAVAFIGVVVMGLEPKGFGQINALALMLFAALAYGVAAILMRRLRGASPMTVQAWTAAAAVPGSLLLSAGLESGQIAALTNAPWQAYAGIAYAGIAASILGHGGMYYLIQRYPVSVVAPYFLLAPIFAVISAVLVLGERLELQELVGGALTLAGVLLITLRQRRRQPLPPEEA